MAQRCPVNAYNNEFVKGCVNDASGFTRRLNEKLSPIVRPIHRAEDDQLVS